MITTAPLPVCTHIVMAVLLYNWGCKADVGTSCSDPGDCAIRQVCDGSSCICDTRYYQSGVTCLIRLNPGVACPTSPTNACKDNSMCTGGVCTCNNDYYDSDGPSASSGTCTAQLALSVSCNSALTGVVQCSDTNAECTSTGGNVCRCQTGYFDSNGYNTPGGTCTTTKETVDSLRKTGGGPRQEATQSQALLLENIGSRPEVIGLPVNLDTEVAVLKVTSVTATSVTTTGVTISWTESATPSQVSSYTVVWRLSGNTAVEGSSPVGKVTSTVITGLSQSTNYELKVVSFESGSRSSAQQIESDASVIVTTNAGLTVGCGVGINCADSNSECVQDDAGTTTVCRCKSGYFDSNGYSTAGGMCVTMFTLAVTGITPVKEGTDTVNISWTPPTEYTDQVNSYRVFWRPAATINGSSLYDAQLTTTVQLVGFTPGQTYTFFVSSVESGSRKQEQITVTPASPITMMPATPTSFLTTDVDGPTIVLSWTLPSGIKTSYDVITTPSLSPTTTATESITYSSGVTDGQRYNISITTVSGNERSDPLVATFRTVSKTPNPPTSLSCKTTTDQSITLSWTAPSLPRGDIQYYVVQRVDIGALFTTTSSLTEYTVSGLQPATPYVFNVATVNDAETVSNQSSYSLQTGCFTKAAMSIAPESLVVSQILSRQFTLKWTVPTVTNGDLSGYRLAVLDGSTCVREVLFTCPLCSRYTPFYHTSSCEAVYKQSVQIQSADLASYTYDVDTLNPYINYTVSVLAVNAAGNGHPNTTYVITDQEVPQSPSTLTADVVSSTEIRVSWTINGPEPGPTTYTLYVIAESPEPSRIETVIVFSTTTLLVTNLEEYRTYTFNLTASTIKGTAAYYSPTLPSAKTNAAAPGPVENFVVARPDGPDFTTVTVSWSLPSVLQRNSDITKFMFAHNATGGNLNSAPELISVVDSVTRTLVVVPQTTYYIEVYAVGTDFSLTEYVGVKSTKIYHAPPGAPEPPSLLICKAATDQTITLAWSAPSQSSGPSIQYYVVNSVTTGAMFSTTSNLTEYTVEYGLKSATTYIFSVASVNDAVIATNQRTYSSQIGCTTTNNVTGCGTDSLFIPGVVLTVTGILALLITLGLLIAFRRNRLCCSSSEPSKQKKYQNVQLSERDNSEYYTTPSGEGESTQYQTLDGNEVAKASVYSEIGGTPRVAVYQNDPGNDRDGGNYESLHGRSNPNFYDELQTKPFGNKGTYKNVKPPQQYR